MLMLTPLLLFPGTCREALAFYADLFEGGCTLVRTYGEAGEARSASEAGRIYEAVFRAPGLHFLAADVPEGSVPDGGAVVLHLSVPTDAQRAGLAAALQDGGGARDAAIRDRFGVYWRVVRDP